MSGFNMKVTPEIERLTEACKDHTTMDISLYGKYDVKRGLRDIDHKGVLAGLMQVSNVQAVKVVDGKEVPCAGSLYYRGYNIKDLTAGFVKDKRFGFEETTYLLLFGALPDEKQLEEFKELLANQRSLPRNFVRDVIMKAPGRDIMNALSRSVLTLYSYDNNPDDISLPNVLRQCLNLISIFPLLSVYGYQAYNHYVRGKSLYIHNPKKELPTIEESFDAFIAKYRGITNARAEQIRDTVNFYKQVAQPLFYFLIDSLDELDDEVMAEMRRTIPFLIKRVGKHQRADIAEFLESGQHKNEKYTRISRATVNKYIKWIKSYLEYLKDKSYTSEDFSESLNTYPSESALMQREHLEKEEINTLINKAKEYDEDIEILVKIHAYSGMRLSEVFKCKLEEKEIEGVGNIKYFDLSDTSLQLKTMPSHRKIPLHNELLSILTKNKFEEIQIKYSSNPDFVSKKINQLINQHISKDKTKVLYSLRHSFATYLKEAMVVESLTAELMGHSRGKTMSYGRYAGSYSLEIMRDTINKLDYSIGGS